MSWPKTPEHGHAKPGDKPAAADLTAGSGGALRQVGAPAMPPASAANDMMQTLLALDWAIRGGR